MFRKLTENDRQNAIDYLTQEASYNVFTIGDIENFGFDKEFQDVWGEFGENGEFRALVLRYYTNHIVYSITNEYDSTPIVEILRNTSGEWVVSGKEQCIIHAVQRDDTSFKKPNPVASIFFLRGL